MKEELSRPLPVVLFTNLILGVAAIQTVTLICHTEIPYKGRLVSSEAERRIVNHLVQFPVSILVIQRWTETTTTLIAAMIEDQSNLFLLQYPVPDARRVGTAQ
ncbi:hypothetical protein RvY_09040 [Ramazzottius varieornatus]|uniref:Uncharacterized protein n=1 Tax=Ramazzottius varieornatus TaxID=947166 RepID=A0A1D1V7Y3_RAMVA|nr:hypothetical protein RvY_09040 [Ramazzottius varieornatus]